MRPVSAGGLDDALQAAVDDRRRPAALGDEEVAVGGCHDVPGRLTCVLRETAHYKHDAGGAERLRRGSAPRLMPPPAGVRRFGGSPCRRGAIENRLAAQPRLGVHGEYVLQGRFRRDVCEAARM